LAELPKKASPPMLFLWKNFSLNKTIRGSFTGLYLVFKGSTLFQLYISPVLWTG
jgi:hypothetical protein